MNGRWQLRAFIQAALERYAACETSAALFMLSQIYQSDGNVVAAGCNVWMALTQIIKAYGKCCALRIKCLFMPAQCPQTAANVVAAGCNV